ncbi:hypothetical protein F383_16145 [Gossypium arboreum]|uniref:Uncharacterized protein n=1 Tax=Gossypium arboreum TaxID=29729 RepID=A0A0B0NJA1_GOSAR|nr:hypothetical protein F383_16145 [Gossypium arboreum]
MGTLSKSRTMRSSRGWRSSEAISHYQAIILGVFACSGNTSNPIPELDTGEGCYIKWCQSYGLVSSRTNLAYV